MKKDDVAQMPSDCNSVIIGLGWNASTWLDTDIDFDASIVCLDGNKEKITIINFAHMQGNGIKHRGDNTTGAGSGDDERIRIDFNKVSRDTAELFVVVNIYTDGITFKKVKDAYVRVCVAKEAKGFDPGHVIAKYPLDESVATKGLVFTRFTRNNDAWQMQALGWGCGGKTASKPECMDIIQGKMSHLDYVEDSYHY